MKRFSFLTPLLALFLLTGAAKKPEMTVRFYGEAHAGDTDHFASPIHLQYPPRDAYIEKAPTITEKDVRGIYPFKAVNGTWGCLFKLDDSGTLRLATISLERKGGTLVAFIGTKKGSRYVIDMIMDKPVNDGLVSIQQGLTEMEIQHLEGQFHPIIKGVRNPR